MPKNQFQRPLPVKHTGKVPRHGPANAPARPLPGAAANKPEPARKVGQLSLPPLEALLAKSHNS